MPFSNENIRTTILLIAVVILAGFAVFGAVVIHLYGERESTPTYVFIAGSVVLSLKVVLSMLQTEMARKESKAETAQAKQEIKAEVKDAADKAAATAVRAADVAEKVAEATKHQVELAVEKVEKIAAATNGQLQDAVRTVAEEVRKAERDQVIQELIDNPEFLGVVEKMIQGKVDLHGPGWHKKHGLGGEKKT